VYVLNVKVCDLEVGGCEPNIQIPVLALRIFFTVKSLSLLLLCFFTPFFFQSTLALHHERLTLYTTTLNDELRVTLSFSPSCPSLSRHG
jgi:hypothetical protein